MPYATCLNELRDDWFPHATDAGLRRLTELLESGSPLLIHGSFTRALPMGCMATHLAWHHPLTEDMNIDAGIAWLTRVAGLNPATSHVIRAWDCGGQHDWDLRQALITACREELARRAGTAPAGASESEWQFDEMIV